MGQQLSFKRKHRGVAPVHGLWSRISKTSHQKLKREVSRMEKRFKIAIMFSGRRRRSREERNGFVKADVIKYKCSFTGICEIFLPLNPSTTTVYARSAFYPSLRFTLSLQSAVRSLRFTLTGLLSL